MPRRGHVLVPNRTHLVMFGGKSTVHWAKESGPRKAPEALRNLGFHAFSSHFPRLFDAFRHVSGGFRGAEVL